MKLEDLGASYESILDNEVRKAGGVYYTPQYIVEYIVQNTVGKFIENKTPREVNAIKIVDPSCGGGIFLIGAYHYLLNWHKDYYTQHGKPGKGRKGDPLTPTGELTTAEKKRILLNNIYGVDLDSNAVEVTKLSLLLKSMEGETKESIETQMKLFHDRVLPDLDSNIKSGNSLIDLDYYANELDFGEERKVKPFSWQKNFPDVFKQGGFDCVIGNPPYGAKLSKDAQAYCLEKFHVGSTDTAALFLVQAKKLLRQGGLNGFIIPKALTYASNWAKTRKKLLDDMSIIVDCSRVWKQVKLEMSIYVGFNETPSKSFLSCIRQGHEIIPIGRINKALCRKFNFILNGVSQKEIQIAQQMIKSTKRISDFLTNHRGGMFQQQIKERGYYKVLGGKQVQRFHMAPHVGFVNKRDITETNAFVAMDSLLVQNIVTHIQNPYPRIQISATIADREISEDYVILDTVNQLTNISDVSSKYLLGVINSRIASWFTYRFVYANAIRTMHFDSTTTKKIPFPELDLANKSEKKKHDEIVKHVDQLLQLNKDLQAATLPERKGQIQSKIDYCEDRINAIVYELYGLTEEEVKVIEGEK